MTHRESLLTSEAKIWTRCCMTCPCKFPGGASPRDAARISHARLAAVMAAALLDPAIDCRQRRCLEIGGDHDRFLRPRGHDPAAGGRVHRREARELGGECRVA